MGALGGFLTGFGQGKKNETVKKIKAKLGGKGKDDGGGGGSAADEMGAETGGMPSKKKGGPIKKTRTYLLHKGERVLNKRQAKRYSKKRG
jgi:hypothetical protein